MHSYKKTKILISIVSAIAVLFSVFCVIAYASNGNAVTATASTSIKQGSTGTCYVYIDSTESLAALDVSVYFDPAKVKINSVTNVVSCAFYDNVTNTDNVRFNYLFDGKGSASKTGLFYFSYQVLSNAELGDAYFDITIGEAYDSALNDVEISGSRFKFDIAEAVTNKTCSVSSSRTVSTSVGKEFSLSYRLSTYQIASGTAIVNYDSELFEVVSATSGEFLGNKATDINTELTDSVYISFAGDYNTKYDLVTIKFKTLKNVAESSKITFKAVELYDVALNPISCSDYETTANITFDNDYIGDAPKMSVSAEYDSDTENVVALISLEKNSKLGAGDFVLSFDPAILSLSSYEKGFEPTYFEVIDKEVTSGKLKLSILSLEDIVTAEKVITVVFDVVHSCNEQNVEITIDGNMITDSFVKPIALNFIDGSVLIPGKHSYGDWITDKEATYFEEGQKYKVCSGCDDTITETIPKLTSPQIDSIKEAISGTTLTMGVVEGEPVIIVPTSKNDVAMTESELAAILNDSTIQISANNGKIGTGCTITIGEYEVSLVVKGDIDGDGIVNVFDGIMVKKALTNNDFANEALREFAADVDGTAGTTEADVDAILSHIVGKEYIG